MPEIKEATLVAFRDELQKTALSPLHGMVSGASALGGVGAAAGGLIGGGRAYMKARREGADVGEALTGSVGAAGRGALVGGALGAAGGAAAGKLRPELGARLTQAPVVGGPARFAQRQVHALTDWKPEAGLESIRGGAWQAKQNVGSAVGGLERAAIGRRAAQEAQDAGLTSVPGYLRALRADPKGAISKGVKEQWYGSGLGTKALTVGLPAISAIGAAAGEDTPGGPGKAERVGRGLLPAATGLATGQVPLAGQLLIGAGAAAAGGLAGRGIDRLRGHKGSKPVPPPYPPESPTTSGEVRITPEALQSAGGAG